MSSSSLSSTKRNICNRIHIKHAKPLWRRNGGDIMKSDIEIAQEAQMVHIREVAAKLDIPEDDLELYGKYKAKLSDELIRRVSDRKDGKLILVTAINPTPAGEGKTTTSVGLGEAFGRLGKRAVIALREPSLDRPFGNRRLQPGGGYAQVVPMEDLNLHFTGDLGAITLRHQSLWQLFWTTIASRAMS